MKRETTRLNLNDIKLNDKNPRTINRRQLDRLVKSVQEFPEMTELRPIVVDENNTILGGNMRYRAMQKLGMSTAEVVKVSGLTDDQKREFIIKDNVAFGDWDWDALANEWDMGQLDEWGLDIPEFEVVDQEVTEVKEDEAPEVKDGEPKAKMGDIYQLGRHRLMCGDCTKQEDVDKLMNDTKADMVFTDPPYGVSYTGGVIHGSKINVSHKRKMLKNDDIDIYSDFIPLLKNVIDNGAIYIFYATKNSYELMKPLKENDIEVHSIICWNKINTGYADMNSNYKNKYEPCIYACRKGFNLNWNGPTTETTIWDIEKDRNNKFHPTQKPIEVSARAIKNSSKQGDKVLDLFGGSGSTLIACEQLNRNCYMMELDPHYVDVIIQRWEDFTGKKAEKIN